MACEGHLERFGIIDAALVGKLLGLPSAIPTKATAASQFVVKHRSWPTELFCYLRHLILALRNAYNWVFIS